MIEIWDEMLEWVAEWAVRLGLTAVLIMGVLAFLGIVKINFV